MASENPQIWILTPERMTWLAGCLVLVVLPHGQRIPAWVLLAFCLFASWRLVNLYLATPLPSRLLRLLFQILVLIGVYIHYGTIMGRQAGVALLIALTGLKLLETQTLRDGFVVILLGYFLVVTNFLFSQSIPTGIFMFLVVILMTNALIRLINRDISPRTSLSLAAGLLIQSLPLMLVLFLFFPRISGPLWGLPKDAHSAVTGLSDSMIPGNISNLSQSDAVAFRVKFDGPAPPTPTRYWRGPVLWDTDGNRWSAGRFRGEPPPIAFTSGGGISYTVTLEPHFKRWLFFLEMPTEIPAIGAVQHDFTVTSKRAVRERTRYRGASATGYSLTSISDTQLRRALDLPVGSHPRARDLAASWRQKDPDPARIVENALDYFTTQSFSYTLNPPLLDGDSIDDFLFLTRRGFCEHYAAAFTVLMRSVGIPARVVTGYQGGEINPVNKYLIVRQRDAHAWVEVWLGDQGWIRVDPTASVAPNRIEQGIDMVLPPRIGPIMALGLSDNTLLYNLWRRLRFNWDAVNNWWNQWVLGYDPVRQKNLLSRFGIDNRNWQHIGLSLLAFSVLPLLAVAIWLRNRLRIQRDPARIVYDRFCRKLARLGVTRASCEGPQAYAQRARARLPALQPQLWQITKTYIRIRYSPLPGDLRKLKKLVRAFPAVPDALLE
ncbi:MAG: DUF3488 domain-containing transglutaminase family protein [Gammaproteobacteria bacterium]|nr:DUF3488 domain-containing transglutaminase family protein [Gammaproteobacteria bacterium]